MRCLFRRPLLWFLLFASSLLAGCSPARGIEAALLLSDLAGMPIVARFVPEPRRTAVAFSHEGRRGRGDLYLSPHGSRGALLLLPGAAEKGKDDPRLVAAATSLARARFAVFVPDLASFRALQIHAGNVREVGDAFAWLSRQPTLAPEGRAGLAAFSYAAGPAILASLLPENRSRALFLLTVGGYYDLPAVLTFFTTGWFLDEDGKWRHLEPNAYGKWVFILSNRSRIPPADRKTVKAMAERKKEDLGADLSDLAQRLTPEGKALYDFVVNTDPRKAPLLLRRLPAEIREDIAALDLATKNLSLLRGRLILVHGYEDSIIPYAQSVALSRAVPPGQAELFLVHGLHHVDLRPGIRDTWRLWRALDALLSQRAPE